MAIPTTLHKQWGRQAELKALASTKFTLPPEASPSQTGSWALEDGSRGSQSGEDLSKPKTTKCFILLESWDGAYRLVCTHPRLGRAGVSAGM